MKIEITGGKATGKVTAPPSKSFAHRMLISAALCEGKSTVYGLAPSEDILATLDCIRALGAHCTIWGDTATVTGINALLSEPSAALGCRESGSTLRFMIPVCLLSGNPAELYGAGRLFSRPLSVYEKICREQGICFDKSEFGLRLRGKLKSGYYEVDADISSQFVSGLLFALPLLSGDSVIHMNGTVASRSYIDITVSAIKRFGVEATWRDDRTIFISGGQKYSPADANVEGDYSNASFFAAMNKLGGEVQIDGLEPSSAQGDRRYIEYFDEICSGTPSLDVTDCPDLAPILMALGAAKNGVILTGTSRLRSKESNRGEAMAQELAKFGAETSVGDDEIFVSRTLLSRPETAVCGHNDHRIVMACAVLMTLTGGEIDGAEAVNKSFPDFFSRLGELGIGVKILEA